jgi:N-acetylmuramoyl-L-alanine amidase
MIEYLLASFLTVSEPDYINDLTIGQKEDWYLIQTQCLADNVYHEARNQGTAGQLAVINVTMNRVNDSRFPNTVCDVVKQGPHRKSWKDPTKYYPIKHKCQFSWYCDGKSDKINDMKSYEPIWALSYQVMSQGIRVPDITDGATFYHADYVSPSWANHKTKTIEIEDHIFYRWEK